MGNGRAITSLVGVLAAATHLALGGATFARTLEQACAKALTTAEMLECTSAALDRANADLATAYDRLDEALDPSRRAKLAAAQRAWEAFRARHSEFVASDAEGGTIYEVLRRATAVAMTVARTAELDAQLQP